MLHCDLRVRWKVASDLRFRAAISESKTHSFCGISGDLAPSTRKSLAIAIVRFWCAKRPQKNIGLKNLELIFRSLLLTRSGRQSPTAPSNPPTSSLPSPPTPSSPQSALMDANRRKLGGRFDVCSLNNSLERKAQDKMFLEFHIEIISARMVVFLLSLHRPPNGPLLEGPFSTTVGCPKTTH